MIHFVCDMPGDLDLDAGALDERFMSSDFFYRPLASVRLRCFLPLSVIGRHMPARLLSYYKLLRGTGSYSPDDIFVFFKLGAGVVSKRPEVAQEVLAFARSHTFICDTCDPLHDSNVPAVSAYQTEMLRLASGVVGGTAELAEQLRPLTGAPLRVIEDTIDCPTRPARFEPERLVRLVWFGWMSQARWSTLGALLERLCQRCPDRAFECLVLSQPLPENALRDGNAYFERSGAMAMRLLHRPWALPDAWDHIAGRDIALLPQEADDVYKSHNRLSTAIGCGIFPVASPIPSYIKVADAGWLGADLAEGVAWALSNPAQAQARIETAQKSLHALFGVEAIGAKWVDFLRALPHGGARYN